MDIALLSRLLKLMLSQHESVTLPGFGKFVMEDVPASFSDKGFTINPPYKKVVFVPSVGDDGLLCECYAKANGVSVSRARDLISECVHSIISDLKNSKQVDMPLFGKLKMTRGGTVLFVAVQGLELRPQLDMLNPISLKSKEVDTIQHEDYASLNSLSDQPEETFEKPVESVAGQHDAQVQADAVPEQPEQPMHPAQPVQPEQAVQPAQPAQPEQVPVAAATAVKRKHMPWWAIVLMVLVALAALAFGALAVLGRTMPQLIDPLLYTKEELDILNTVI